MSFRRDPMTPEQRIEVLTRDEGCVALRIDPDAGECAGPLQVDHVRPFPGSLTDSSPRHCVSVCRGHHQDSRAGRIWATAHRAEMRAYLEGLYEADGGHEEPFRSHGGREAYMADWHQHQELHRR